MKRTILLLALLGFAFAQRQPARDVITKFKEVAPQYLDLLKTGETELNKIRSETTDLIANFHVDVIQTKESFVVDAISRETAMHFQINNQPESVDIVCLGFLNTTVDMSMNLAGVGFTNCINNVDDAFNGLVGNYFNVLGVQEGLLNELRLLDVFRGDNVFYTPQNIIDKLNKKLSEQKINPETFSEDLEQAVENLKNDLENILTAYGGCMTQADQLLKNGVDMMMMQLTFSCLGTVIVP
ncbi:AAEL013777-PA [Aedes aegypti]|uniref:AAEL013777-PA n=1 Tax=Aedes aegypti TaxID=7159 RepID=Q16I63_AEDAE|nr:AAEL013777-PA [Aedes aegypti]